MHSNAIRLVGFDGDDTLWRSQDYFDEAQLEFERIVGAYVDLADARVHERLYEVESRNLALFGYGVKGMALSMIEAAVEITAARISARDLHRIVQLGKGLLQHPVELLPGIARSGGGDRRRVRRRADHQGRPVPPGSEGAAVGLGRPVPPHRDRQREGSADLRARAGGIRPAAAAVRDDRQFAALGHRAGAASSAAGACTCRTTRPGATRTKRRSRATRRGCAWSPMPLRCRPRSPTSPQHWNERTRTMTAGLSASFTLAVTHGQWSC